MKSPEVGRTNSYHNNQDLSKQQQQQRQNDLTEISLKDKENKLAVFLEQEETVNRPNKCFHHFRYLIMIMGGFATGTMLFLRLAFSIAIVSMVNRTALYEGADNTTAGVRQLPDDYVERGEFAWTNEIQQTILSGYMVAYTLPQVYSTKCTMKYGIRRSIPLALSICAISVLLTPVAAYWGWEWVLALRLLNGIGASPMYPSLLTTVEKWSAKGEKTGGLALAQFSCNLIYSSTPLITGFLAKYHWQWCFYVPGGCALVFCILYYILVSSNPAASAWISQKELDHIAGKTAAAIDGANGSGTEQRDSNEAKQKAGAHMPWYFMFRLPEFYVILSLWLLYCCTSGGFAFLLPPYLDRILSIPIEEIGAINFIVQIGSLFCMLWSGPATALFQHMFGISLTASRKMAITLCSGIAVLTFIYLGYAHSNIVITIVLNRFFHQSNDTLFFATIMSQYGHAGVSGLVYSMANTFGNLSTTFFCWAVGRFLDKFGESLNCWSGVMYTIAGLNILYILIYVLFCNSTPVNVNRKSKNKKSDDKKSLDISTRC